jgi:beta-glucosidase
VLSKDGTFGDKPDVAVVVFGEGPYAEFEGDRETLEYSPGDQHDLELLRRLRAKGVPTVAVFLSGRPMWVNPQINASDAFVAAWLPGSEGEGIADVLFSSAGAERYDFTGRLGFSWPQTAMPVSFDAAGTVSGAEFPRGWGLDYGSAGSTGSIDNRATLSEDPKIPAHWAASRGSLFHEGHVTAPWSIFVADDSAEVHLTTARQESPRGAVVAEADPDGVRAIWAGPQSGMFRISGRARDMRPQAGQGVALDVRYRVERTPQRSVLVGMRCAEPLCGTRAGAMLDVTKTLKNSPVGEWRTLSVPLSCFSAAGADLGSVVIPFAVETSGSFAITISDVSLQQKSAAAAKCPTTL